MSCMAALDAIRSVDSTFFDKPWSVVPQDERVWTYVHYTEPGKEWPFTTIGYVFHRPDLSDLGEPYLSAVKEALASRAPRNHPG